MFLPSRSSLVVAVLLGLAACAETRISDHATEPAAVALDRAQIGRPLLVVESALGTDDPDRIVHATEAVRLIGATLPGETAGPDSDAHLLARARANGLERVLIVRVEDYARHGTITAGIAIPPVTWDTWTVVSLRVRLLDAQTGAVLADFRRDRRSGGAYVIRADADLPGELHEALRPLLK